jgi:hypothetical protein
MKLSEEKQWIKDEIDKIDDESLLSALRNIIDFARKKDTTLAPLTMEDLKRRALESEEDIKNGRVIDFESLKKDSKEW